MSVLTDIFLFVRYVKGKLQTPSLHPHGFRDVFNRHEGVANLLDVGGIEDRHEKFAFKDAVSRGERDALNLELRELVQHVGNGIKHALRVHAAQKNGNVEEQLLVRVPTAGHDVVAVARL